MGGKPRTPALLDPEHAAFVQSGVSVLVSSCNDDLVADVVRGCGCRVSRDRRRVTVLVDPDRAGEVLDDIRRTGTIAVVFSLPSTHHTIQLKGRDATVAPAAPGDRQVAARHLDGWVAELVSIGYRADLAAAVRGSAERGLVAIAFTPDSAFQQTPGPAAGTRLRAAT